MTALYKGVVAEAKWCIVGGIPDPLHSAMGSSGNTSVGSDSNCPMGGRGAGSPYKGLLEADLQETRVCVEDGDIPGATS